MEGGYEGLCLLGGAHGSLGLDCDYRGVRRGCFCCAGVPLGAISCDVSLLIALEAESALDPLSLFLVCECGACPCSPYVHGVRVSIVKGVPPLRFCRSSPSIVSPDPFFVEYIFLLVFLCRCVPVVPRDWVVEFDTVGHQFEW